MFDLHVLYVYFICMFIYMFYMHVVQPFTVFLCFLLRFAVLYPTLCSRYTVTVINTVWAVTPFIFIQLYITIPFP